MASRVGSLTDTCDIHGRICFLPQIGVPPPSIRCVCEHPGPTGSLGSKEMFCHCPSDPGVPMVIEGAQTADRQEKTVASLSGISAPSTKL